MKAQKALRVLLATMLAFTLSLSVAAPAAHAADPLLINTAAITKVLQVPIGTDYPAMTFTFTVTAEEYNGSTTLPLAMPVIGTAGVVSIAFDGAVAATPAETLLGTSSDVSTYYLESAELFGSIAWPTAGSYKYSIVETGSNYTIASPDHEALEFSQAEYFLTVYVREYKASDPEVLAGTANAGDRYIYAIGAERTLDDEGTAVTPTPEKVDPTPGGDGVTTVYSDMAFTNKYVKTNGAVDPGDPDPTDSTESTLNITKTVAGTLGSIVLPFDFSVTLTVPTLISGYVQSSYAAYIVEGNTIVDPTGLTSAFIGTDASSNKYLEVVPGTAATFKLTHGQKLVFINTPVGSSYAMSETGVPSYITSAKVTVDGMQGADDVRAVDTGIALPGGTVYDYTLYVGEGANSVDVLNTYGDVTPAGIIMQNGPYLVLVLLAIGGLVVFVVAKQRKRQEENQL